MIITIITTLSVDRVSQVSLNMQNSPSRSVVANNKNSSVTYNIKRKPY